MGGLEGDFSVLLWSKTKALFFWLGLAPSWTINSEFFYIQSTLVWKPIHYLKRGGMFLWGIDFHLGFGSKNGTLWEPEIFDLKQKLSIFTIGHSQLICDQIFYFYFCELEQNKVASCKHKLHHPICIWPQICSSYFLRYGWFVYGLDYIIWKWHEMRSMRSS